MTDLTFDEDQLAKRLARLPMLHQLAFAVCCCMRLLPNYVAFKKEVQWGNVNPLEQATALAWAVVAGEVRTADLAALRDQCKAAAPDSERFDTMYSTFAQNACFAVYYVVDWLREPEPSKLVKPASYARDTVDLFVQEIDQMAPDDPDLEEKIRLHPVMQRELQWQDGRLAELEACEHLRGASLESFRSECETKDADNLRT